MRKSAPLVQVKAGPEDGLDEGQFTGYASVFGNRDSYGDVVQPGAFKETLAEWDDSQDNLPVLWGHDMGDPFSNIGVVTKAVEDEKGLRVTAQLDLENPKAAQVYRLLKQRAVGQMSFAYDVLEGHSERSEDEGEFYSLDKLKLYEVSIVPLGANQETEILAVKVAREIAGKAGRVISAKNETALREALSQLEGSAEQIKNVLSALESTGDDQEKARATEPPPSDEEPDWAKSDAPAAVSPAHVLAVISIAERN
jgi:HK97 family phage prohead protease